MLSANSAAHPRPAVAAHPRVAPLIARAAESVQAALARADGVKTRETEAVRETVAGVKTAVPTRAPRATASSALRR